MARALAFARLAAIAAATLLFFAAGVIGAMMTFAPFGHAFSNCFLAVLSNETMMIAPLSFQIPSKTQKAAREASRTAGLLSARPLLMDFSRGSNASVAYFIFCPCASRNTLMWPAPYCRILMFLSCMANHIVFMNVFGWGFV